MAVQGDLIIALAARHRVPAIFTRRNYVTSGGLISYGPNPIDAWKPAAAYVDRILKGRQLLPKAAVCPLFEYLIGALLELQRNVEAERLGSLEIDHQLELYRDLDGKLAWFRAFENAIGISRGAPIIVEGVISIGRQAADFGEETERIDGRKPVASRQGCDLCTMGGRERIRHHDQAAIRFASVNGNDGFEFGVSRTDATIASTAKDAAAALKQQKRWLFDHLIGNGESRDPFVRMCRSAWVR